jgi:glycosyltransferase involved in cell wall biosynthesis
MPSIETLYHGLDRTAVQGWDRMDGVREELEIPSNAPIVGTVANFKAHKGYGYLLNAALRIRRALPETRFVFVGGGPYEDVVRRRVSEVGLEDAVIFAGVRDDVPRVVRTFDVFVQSSIAEGLSIALVEALTLGRPVIVTGDGGYHEVVRDGNEGFIVPPRDPEALATGAVTLLNDDRLRDRMGAAGRRRSADFDIRVAVSRIEQVYREVL